MVKSTSRRIKSISKRPAGKAAPRKPAAPAKAPPKKPSAKAPAKSKWVFGFGNGKAEGRADMRNLLGGKGAGLAEMANLGLPVPAGFTITTAVCTHYYENGNAYPKNLQEQVRAALAQVEPVDRHFLYMYARVCVMGSYSESEKASQHREMPSNAVAAFLLSGRDRPFPFTTRSFRACASGSRTANNG